MEIVLLEAINAMDHILETISIYGIYIYKEIK